MNQATWCARCARRSGRRGRASVGAHVPAALLGDGPAHRLAVLHARRLHLPGRRVRPRAALGIRHGHAHRRHRHIPRVRSIRAAHRAAEQAQGVLVGSGRPYDGWHGGGGPRAHSRRGRRGGHHTCQHRHRHRRRCAVLPVGRSVQPDGSHAHAHVRRAVLHRGSRGVVPHLHDGGAVRRYRHRTAAPRIAGMRAPELSPVANRARRGERGALPHSVEAHRDHGHCRLAVQLLRRVPLGHGIRRRHPSRRGHRHRGRRDSRDGRFEARPLRRAFPWRRWDCRLPSSHSPSSPS